MDNVRPDEPEQGLDGGHDATAEDEAQLAAVHRGRQHPQESEQESAEKRARSQTTKKCLDQKIWLPRVGQRSDSVEISMVQALFHPGAFRNLAADLSFSPAGKPEQLGSSPV